MKKIFFERSEKRKHTAYLFLLLAIALIIFLFTQTVQMNSDNSKAGIDIYLTFITRLSFVFAVVFLVQILLKHYRYNMLKADYYLSCVDTLSLIEEFKQEGNEEDDKKFIALFSTLIAEKTPLDNVENPNIQLTNLSK